VPKPEDLTSAPGELTRLPSPHAPTPSGAGWLSSSDEISHGRFAPGTVLADRYRILALLGKGGMGEVYRADDLKLGQPVALKFLPPELSQDPVRLAQFHGEVRLTRQVSHPNVCRVYDVGDVDGLVFLSMEYVDGEDLASLLRQIGRFPEDKALEIARQLCAGVAAAHDRGVLHRDLKPANVMIDESGRVRVMDFGLAVAAGSSVEVRAGTPGYMAPEQLAGRDVTPRSDIYAIGLVLYELFTGRRALAARSVAELLRLHEEGTITPPTSIVTHLDPAIERAILRAIDRDPSRRPDSALALSAALPGGDPLAAALAAGETPSPAMVAAAGHEHALPLPIAWSGIIVTGLALLVLPFVIDRVSLPQAMHATRSLDVLADRAQTLVNALGYTDTPRDEFFSIAANDEYLTHVSQSDRSPDRWADLRRGRPPGMVFWYRSSPRPLVRLAPDLLPTASDPPLVISGMTRIATDMTGRLIEFDAVPPPREIETASPPVPNWAALFAAADIAMPSFTPTTPTWTPRVYADTRAAWEGTLPEDPNTRVRIEAAAYRGRAVYFQIVWPWSRANRMELAEQSTVDTVLSAAGTIVLCAIFFGAAFSARRHLRRGRGDRRGADRLALFIIATFMVTWAFGAHHIADVNDELNLFFLFLALALLIGGIIWLFYLALEPMVRKWQARALVGWSRLLAGAVHDPQVGRDVLVGTVAGSLLALLRVSRGLMPALIGAPPPAPVMPIVEPLLAARQTVAALAGILPTAVSNALLLILVFAVLRVVFRHTWLVVAVLTAVMVAFVSVEALRAPGGWTHLPLALLGTAGVLIVVVRFGLLATAVMFYVGSLLELMPLTADPSMRYFASSMWLLAGVLALTVYAAYSARAGQGLWRFAD
jgi:Protein kinase domain